MSASYQAHLGGGITVDVVYDAYGCVNADNKLFIENCSFDNNAGYQGSSAYFLGTSGCQTLLNTTISFTNFTSGHCEHVNGLIIPCFGSVILRHFPIIKVINVILFTENYHSALSLTASSIELLPSAELKFTNNSGYNGAALHIVDCSSVIINDNTSLYFENNQASNHGGAIYSEACNQEFIKHSNSTLNPNQWNVTVLFIENQAHIGGDSIYIDLQTPQSYVWFKNTTFCWKGWFYGETDSCLTQIRTSAAYLVNNGPTKYKVYPGECISLKDVTAFDELNNNITHETDLQVDVLAGEVYTIARNNPYCLLDHSYY